MIRTVALTKRYRNGTHEVVPVREVSLEIGAGEIAFVVGPSGSGKSTLLNLLGALDTPSEGRVEVSGLDLGVLTDRQRALFRREAIGFVFQTYNLLPPLTALENACVPLLPDGPRPGGRSEAAELLRSLGLAERLDHRPSQLSGGEQQRVALARALVRKPKLLLADEPTGNLDSETGRDVMEALRAEVKSRGMTAVIVTHAREHIRPGDRVLAMRDGRVTEDGREGR